MLARSVLPSSSAPDTGTTDQSLPAWLYTDAGFFEAERRQLFCRNVAPCMPCKRYPERRRLLHARHPRREIRRPARRRRDGAQLSQCLPPPRLTDRRWQQRQLRSPSRLPLPRLELRSRRHAEEHSAGAGPPRHSTRWITASSLSTRRSGAALSLCASRQGFPPSQK